MRELVFEAPDVGHANRMCEGFEHALVVGRVAHIEPAAHLRLQIAAPQQPGDPARAFPFVVRAKPAVDVNRADRRIHAFALHDADDLRDALRRKLRKLAVVDGDVGFAPGAVLRQRGARHVAQHAGGHSLHAREVGLADVLVLRIVFLQIELLRWPCCRPALQSHRAVFSHDGVYRPGRGKRQAPAHRPAGDRHHTQPGGFELAQCFQCVRRDRAFGGQRVIDVREDAGQALEGVGGKISEGAHGCRV